jgi:predicted GH43/DUF377 family glycosyl hydrolase
MRRCRFLFVFICTFFLFQFTTAQINWERHESNPVLPVWNGGVDDPSGYKYTLAPSVIFDTSKNIYRSWFSSLAFGYGTSFCVSSAISENGTDWYVLSKNPVLSPTPGTFDRRNIHQSYVIRDDIEYKMYYTGQNDATGLYCIGLALSQDGIRWEKYSDNPILKGDTSPSGWDQSVVYPVVIFDGTKYWMWYSGMKESTSRTGLAVSNDGIHWEKSAFNPILNPGTSGTWDEYSASCAAVCKVDSLWYMIYVSSGSGAYTKASLGFAVSNDGINWNKYNSNPIMTPSSSISWENANLGRGTVLFKDNKFHFWYCAQNSSNGYWQSGYATSDFEPLAVKGDFAVPEKFKVYQNYPNPFNPSTLIQYNVPYNARVKIRIVDMLGRYVSILLDEEKSPGSYKIIWDGMNEFGMGVSNGTYFCHVEFYNEGKLLSSHVKKMMLLK